MQPHGASVDGFGHDRSSLLGSLCERTKAHLPRESREVKKPDAITRVEAQRRAFSYPRRADSYFGTESTPFRRNRLS
jgi:hypothetical protein